MKCPHCDGTGELSISGASTGDLIMAHRKAAGLTQEELALKTDVGRPQIGNVEINKSEPSLRVLRQIAAALGISPKDLIP